MVAIDNTNKITVEAFAATQRNRRGHTMSASYIYRLIRETEAGECTRKLWFKYQFTGDKDRIYIIK